MRTESENIFESYCLNKKVNFSKIEESSTKTPDYLIKLDNYKFIVEITQFELNEKEKGVFRSLNPNQFTVYYPEDEKRVRQKIKDKAKQLKTRKDLPIVLVFYDNRSIFSTLDSDSIKYALYGDDSYTYYYENEQNNCIFLKPTFGKGKTLTEENKNYISAIGFLTKKSDKINLIAYHNYYAEKPLDKFICKKIFNKQFEISPDLGRQQDWKGINAYNSNRKKH